MNGGKTEDEEPESPASIYSAEKMRKIEELGFDPAFQRDKLRALKAKQ